MKTKQIILLLMVILGTTHAVAQDTLRKSGWSFGALPSVMFDTDIGFQYGAILNAFQYGDGRLYPDYRYMVYAEWSRQTKGGAINQLFFDAPHLLSGDYRITAELSYLTEKALDFYGFNGREARWEPGLEDPSSEEYLSRMFYRHQRRLLRTSFDVQHGFREGWRWIAGLMHTRSRMGSVDLGSLNQGLTGGDVLPDTFLLYDLYRVWGLFPAGTEEGGAHTFLRAGLVFDTRDAEANPMHGLWSEAVIWYAPALLGDHRDFIRYNLIHRQYHTFQKEVLSLAARIGAQGSLAGETPWYVLPFMLSSFDKATTRDGLGGARTIRGILRNRVVGDGVAYANMELRWKFLRTTLWGQNLYLALSGFTDGGLVTRKFRLDTSGMPEGQDWAPVKDRPHLASGLGLHIALNENFIVTADYGKAWSGKDGDQGFYINIGFLY
ncbi:MAG TPA: BamA/TamA family outer membrane protein [Bacteroidales bacterium]|nr:BamA/TamA family outer membrane protein [Bacteroidales bacterium]HRZ76088.1 BamA/TamA family outer membrane protein [Bacteroidales bacterium]